MTIIRCDLCKKDINPIDAFVIVTFNKTNRMLQSKIECNDCDICQDCYDRLMEIFKEAANDD